jgi:hypothetical protein
MKPKLPVTKWTGLLVGTPLLVLVLYVFSCGPMFAAYTNDKITWKTYCILYAPVIRFAPLGWFNWYTNVWDRWIGGDLVPESAYE